MEKDLDTQQDDLFRRLLFTKDVHGGSHKGKSVDIKAIREYLLLTQNISYLLLSMSSYCPMGI